MYFSPIGQFFTNIGLKNIDDNLPEKIKEIYELEVEKENYIHSPYGKFILEQMKPIKDAWLTIVIIQTRSGEWHEITHWH